ncbi:MAG TPA: MBOAT family O-acyltransferase [Acidocella sp.]|uniref:MBOAT family O-acyltransferase n=1 Tax=Acidocella sp. TaxID=50710 RepID=UPI002BAE9640|nr:MBOAT family O-acyltransferase [Acidocella sp.]HVE22619.1 MBOAT family O-acyltransferase [Acidocella sp.]
MLFNSRLFVLAFLPLALGGFFALGRCGRRAVVLWLLACSLVFYAWGNPASVLLLLGSIGGNYLLARRLARGGGRGWLAVGLAGNLLLLGVGKYARLAAPWFGSPFGGWPVPLGISFFTFQQIMFLVDLYRRDIALPGLLDYACFIAFFPHLISGPIVRPGHILPQLAALAPSRDMAARLAEGAEIFLLGLSKKLLLADSLARFADPGFAAAGRHDPLTLIEAWVALLAYGAQIYFDFSGYCDMAVGLARMFGIIFPQNFNRPYRATSVSDFWRRWNITLSLFLRDYLYIPLGGNRRGAARRVANLMITMLLGGLWHGAAWRFLLWGGLHGLFLVIQGFWAKWGWRLPQPLAWGLTLLCVLLAWVPFRAPGWAATMDFYAGLCGAHGVALPSFYAALVPGLAKLVHIVPVLPWLGDARTVSLAQAGLLLGLAWFVALAVPEAAPGRAGWGRSAALVAGFGFCMQALFFAPAAVPFLYFQF